ncbi:MAG TPA: AI-2E family transporter [Gemmatimonadales bacterium]|nr:AI-2E family transporter [Gemmatimonadales bacterium]
MPFIDTKRQRAALLISALGLGLAYALWPFITGLMGALVLYVVFSPLARAIVRLGARPGIAAGIVVLVGIVLVLGPGVSFIGLLANQAQDMAQSVLSSPLLARLRELKVGEYDIGAQIEQLGSQIVSWAGSSALSVVGTATRVGIQLTIAFFGLFYLLVAPAGAWSGIRPFIPFSAKNAELLRARFRDVTFSTIIGTGLTATVQGLFVGIAFAAAGLANAAFWGVVTIIVAILPIVGSGLIWGPAAASLALAGRYGWAMAMVLWGILVVGNVDNVIRPYVFRRWARIHPFITVIGAFAGINWFGLLGLLIGPLAISYFFELIRMYRAEYLEEEDGLPA